jgi:proteasome beta subunit|tara:strand:+ start:1574 stop:2203 length:630 start_codon:yes stop_codon:yes gene_type:complete
MAEIDAKKGTTTVGIVYKDGVVLATDQRVTMGNMVISKVEKVFPITDFLAITTAGTVSDNQMLVKHMRAEMKLYELEGERKATVETFSSVLQNVVYSGYKRWQPYMIQAIIAGRSRDGSFKLFSFDPSAASVEDRYTATGSGMMFALGIIQDNYKEGMSEVEAVELAARSIYAAIRRDTATGEGIAIAIIDKNGYRRLNDRNISMILNK